jgi:hypothetical protein
MLLQEPLFHKDGHDIGLVFPFAFMRHVRRDQAKLMRPQGLLSHVTGFVSPSYFGTRAVERKKQLRLPVMMLRPTSRF